MEPNDNSKSAKQSKLGLYSLISGVVLVLAGLLVPDLPVFINSSANGPYCIALGVLALAALACVVKVSVPSFKKSGYPNTAGLIGLILNTSIIVLLCYDIMNVVTL